MPLMEAIGAYAPYISYAALAIFVLTCVMVVMGVAAKLPRARLKVMIFVTLVFAGLLGVASGVLYIWHWYYRV